MTRNGKIVPRETIRHGYDGNPPKFPEVRDLEGKGKRSVKSLENQNSDRIIWLHAHGKLDDMQRDAAERFRKLWKDAELSAFSTFSGGRSGGGTFRLADIKLDAIQRRKSLRARLTSFQWRVIELVVIDDLKLEELERRMQLGRGRGLRILVDALEALIALNGLA